MLTHHTSRRAAATFIVLSALGASTVALAGPAAQASPTRRPATRAAAAAPTPTPARVGKPTSMAVLGDSISQSTGTGELSKENPKNSWATGWEVNSVRNRLGIAQADAQNLSANGEQMKDMDDQVNSGKETDSGRSGPLSASTQYVVVELGGNDLCRDTVAAMTSVADYRTQLKQGLAAIKAKAPNALVYLQSVPDIYNLWYIRGAPQNATYHPEPESDQSAGYNGARFYWGQSFFPCHSLLDNPDSYASADEARRQQVRARNEAYNTVLQEECARELRCRYDGGGLFNLTSNRVSPNGARKPYAQWTFVDADISRNEGAGKYLCPAQGVVAGGCGDHFHPTKQGQVKLADNATNTSYQWSDTTAPTVGMTVTSPATSDGTYRRSAVVHFTGSDSAGLKGQEVRVHRPDGTVTAWSPTLGVAPDRTITDLGTTYLEARSIDVNGNVSASKVQAVTVVPSAPDAPATASFSTSTADGLPLRWSRPVDDGGAPVTAYRITTFVGPDTTGTTTEVAGSLRAMTLGDVSPGDLVRATVQAVNSGGIGVATTAGPTAAPFATLSDFVARQHQDFVGRAPTATESAAAVSALAAGTTTPVAHVLQLADGPAWVGTLGPIIRLYQAYFLRAPDTSGMDFWLAKRRAGWSLNKISQNFALSKEFKVRYGSLTNRQFVERIYQNVLGRAGEPSGVAYWTKELDRGVSRGQVMVGFSNSAEYTNQNATAVLIHALHRGLLGRAATLDEIATWQALVDVDHGTALVRALLGTPAYRARITS